MISAAGSRRGKGLCWDKIPQEMSLYTNIYLHIRKHTHPNGNKELKPCWTKSGKI